MCLMQSVTVWKLNETALLTLNHTLVVPKLNRLNKSSKLGYFYILLVFTFYQCNRFLLGITSKHTKLSV